MKAIKRIAGVVLLLLGLHAKHCTAQSEPPPVPPLPEGHILDVWLFESTNYTSAFGERPMSFTNLSLTPDWDGNSLVVDSEDPAALTYSTLRNDEWPAISFTNGSISMWFSADWNSTDQLGNWGTLIEAGTWSTNSGTAWGLYISPDGSNICFSAENGAAPTNYLFAPINWNAGDFHCIVLTYSATNSDLYLDGQPAASGSGVTGPDPTGLTNGFSVGSDGNGTGMLQSRGIFNDLVTYDYPLSATTISNDYATESPDVYSLSSGSGFSADFSPPPLPGGGGGTPEGGSGGGGPGYTPTVYTNGFYLQILAGANGYNLDPNSATVILNGTIADVIYQLMSTTNLNNPVWELEQTLIGSEVTNFTVTTVSMVGRPTLFFKAMAATLDSDGDGLPDWWETKYSTSSYPLSPTNADTGDTGIPDGYKQDSAGDGYNNLQKYQMGIPPNVFVAPPAPVGFTMALNTNGDIVFNWPAATSLPSAGAGAVTGYTLSVNPNTEVFGTNLTFTAGELGYNSDTNPASYSDLGLYLQFPGYWGTPTYSFQVNYANTNSAWVSNQVPFSAADTVQGAVVRGPGGGLYLAVSDIPNNVTAMRLLFGVSDVAYPLSDNGFLSDSDQPYSNPGLYYPPVTGSSFAGMGQYFDIPVASITNGFYQIPSAQVPLYAPASVVTLGVGQDGYLGYVFAGTPTNDWGLRLFGGAPGAINIPFIDGRTNIAQNISFLLRGADMVAPFAVEVYPQIYSGAETGASYVYAGFSFLSVYYGYNDNYLYTDARRNEFQPFEDSYFYGQAAFGIETFDDSGNPTNGATFDDGPYAISLPQYPTLPTGDYVLSNVTNYPAPPIAPLLSGDVARWILTSSAPWDSGCDTLDINAGTFILTNGARNLYGLPIESVKYFSTSNTYETAEIGTAFNDNGYNFFLETDQPALNTVGYYFARPSSIIAQGDPIPGDYNFSVTNATPSPIIVPFGQPFFLTAWAKQAVTNGFSGVYAYPQQYFDKAYLADTNGNATTNETGILSEYGDFFPTQPGQVILTTKPDVATGTTGQCAINVIKMQLDVNHDGTMDTNFAGPDNTSVDRPFRFWINNDNDGVGVGQDVENPPPNNLDFQSPNIRSQRDLEDYARLWIMGLPPLSYFTNGYSVGLYWRNVTGGNPSIKVFRAWDNDGGTGYLTNTNSAIYQTTLTNYCRSLGTVSSNTVFYFPLSEFESGGNFHYLFEGAATGQGELVLNITQSGTNVASTSAFIDLRDVRELYERVIITNNYPQQFITNLASGIFKIESPSVVQSDEDTNIIIFAHGGDNTIGSWLVRSDTIFKRLYWSGYHGRFASVRWPSPEANAGTILLQTGLAWFNVTELIGYNSASPLASYVATLTDRFPGYNLHMWAHSAGGFIGSEAARLGAPFKTLILSAASVAASCYDVNTLTNATLSAADATVSTPEWQPQGYRGIYTNLTVKTVSYFNTNDALLGFGTFSWAGNQLNHKPSAGYYFDGTNSHFGITNLTIEYYQVTNFQESRAMVSRSRTTAIGATGPAPGQTIQGIIRTPVDAGTTFSLGPTDPEHGAIFMRPYQTIWPYYQNVLDNIQTTQ